MMHFSQMCWTGFLFRAQPTLMTLERSAIIMDAIFASHEEEGRGRLLKILQDFLVSEASKHAAKEKGTVFGFSEAYVSYALIRRIQRNEVRRQYGRTGW
jgi:hypothetical protein